MHLSWGSARGTTLINTAQVYLDQVQVGTHSTLIKRRSPIFLARLASSLAQCKVCPDNEAIPRIILLSRAQSHVQHRESIHTIFQLCYNNMQMRSVACISDHHASKLLKCLHMPALIQLQGKSPAHSYWELWTFDKPSNNLGAGLWYKSSSGCVHRNNPPLVAQLRAWLE